MEVGKTKALRIAFNMFCCASLFFWAKPWPRETISGLFGRKSYDYYFVARRVPWFWNIGTRLIDALHRKELDHCVETAMLEAKARRVLGYHQ